MTGLGDKLRALPFVFDGSDGPEEKLVPICLPLRDALADALDALEWVAPRHSTSCPQCSVFATKRPCNCGSANAVAALAAVARQLKDGAA